MFQNISRPHRPQQFEQGATSLQQHECSLLNNIHQLSRNIAVLTRMAEVPALRKPLASLTAHAHSLPHFAGAYPEFMPLPARDSELIQIMDAEFARVIRISGPWLACRPGCTQCCHGAFAINALDAARLRTGMGALRQANPILATRIEARAQSWLAAHGSSFPGNIATSTLGTSESDQQAFADFAHTAA